MTGRGVHRLDGASGGYRVQRVPPTEKRGRVHTSTVTVAVMEAMADQAARSIPESELRVEWFGGTVKAGGQHRNKHANSCRLTHRPTGVQESRQGRKREANYREALQALTERVRRAEQAANEARAAALRRRRVGSGERGDKLLTIRFQDDSVTHHATGARAKAKRFMRGEMDILLR